MPTHAFRQACLIVAQVSVLGVGFVLLASGCASPAPPGQCKVRVSLGARYHANPDREGKSQATPLTFWQLNNVQPLQEAGFEDIWERPAEAMGESVVEKREYTIHPGKTVKENMLIAEETTHVAVTAIFREVEGTGWRTYVKLPPAQTIERCEEGKVGGPLFVRIDGYKLVGSSKPFQVEAPPAKKEDETGGGEGGEGDNGKKKKKKKKKK